MWQNKYVEYLSGQVNMFDELEILLARLQKNEANVSPELLATKYKESYDKLKEKIKICIQAMILALLSDHMLFSQSDNDIMKSTKNNILNFVRSNEKMNTIYRTAYVTYNFNTVMEFISDISAEIEATYYLPYWFSKIIQNNGVSYSTITHYWRINGSWVRPYDQKIMVANKETVILKSDESYIGFPATVEEVKTLSYYEEYREYIKEAA